MFRRPFTLSVPVILQGVYMRPNCYACVLKMRVTIYIKGDGRLLELYFSDFEGL